MEKKRTSTQTHMNPHATRVATQGSEESTFGSSPNSVKTAVWGRVTAPSHMMPRSKSQDSSLMYKGYKGLAKKYKRWENIFAKRISNKRPEPRIYKEPLKLSRDNPVKQGAKDLCTDTPPR